MPKPKRVLNAFTAREASEITGLSVHMLNYLARHEYLVPAYLKTGIRGKTRYYSYRDLVIAKLVGGLLRAGLELRRLKAGISKMQADRNWIVNGKEKALRLLVTDGKSLYFPDESGSLLDLTQNGQLAFAFVLDVAAAQGDVRNKLAAPQIDNFSLTNHPLQYAVG